jgi:hypothetical protein
MKWIPHHQGEIVAKEWEKNPLQLSRKLLQNQQANFNQTWYTSFLAEWQ